LAQCRSEVRGGGSTTTPPTTLAMSYMPADDGTAARHRSQNPRTCFADVVSKYPVSQAAVLKTIRDPKSARRPMSGPLVRAKR
jgi:hypothetical protein